MIEVEYGIAPNGKRYPIRMLGGVYRAKYEGNIKVIVGDDVYYPSWFKDDSSEYKNEIISAIYGRKEVPGQLEYKGKFGFNDFKDTYDMNTRRDILSDLIDKDGDPKYFVTWIEDIKLEGCKIDWYTKDKKEFGIKWLRTIVNENE